MSKYSFYLPRFHTNATPWVRILKEAGHEVSMHCIIKGKTENYLNVEPFIYTQSGLSKILGGDTNNDIRLFPSMLSIYRKMRDEDPNLVIVRGLTRWFCRFAALCALLQRRQLVIYDQEVQNPRLSGTWIRRVLCRAVGIQHFTPKIDPGERKSLGHATALPFGRPIEANMMAPGNISITNKPPKILMVAKYRDRKRHVDLLRALSFIANRYEFSLTLCGELASAEDFIFCKKIKEHANNLGIADRVQFINNVPHQEMHGIYRAHDIFVLPSVNEPAAISPVEASWFGCACIVASDSGTRFYLPVLEFYEFSPGDWKALSGRIEILLSSDELILEARKMCLENVMRLASDDKILRIFEGLVK